MNILEMSKAPKNSDKLSLIKQEEEALEEHHSKHETNSCGRRCRVLLYIGVLIGMIVFYYSVQLGWQYMEQLRSNETSKTLKKYDLIYDINGDNIDTSIKVNENIYERNIRSTQTANKLQSKKNNFFIKEDNLLHEDETALHKEDLQVNSNDIEILEKIIENEQILSKTKENGHVNNQETKQVIDMQKIRDHQITEDEDKLIVNNKILIKNKYLRNSSDLDSNFRTTISKNMNRIYHITGKNKNLSLGIYCGIALVCGILLIIAFGLIIRFLYKLKCIKMMSKYKRLKEEQEYEINKRHNPLYCVSPKNPGTPIDKDLRFTIKRDKVDMFYDIYDYKIMKTENK